MDERTKHKVKCASLEDLINPAIRKRLRRQRLMRDICLGSLWGLLLIALLEAL